MATSGETSTNTTRDIIVLGALRLVGAYASTELPKPDQTKDAITALNLMLKSWQVGGFLWIKQFVEVPLVIGQVSYDLPDDVNTTFRPTRVFSVQRKNTSGNEVDLTSMSRSDYRSLPNKTSQGTPVQYYYDPQISTGKLYVWPTSNNATDILVLDVDRPINTMVDADNNYDFPEEWLEVLKYGLAIRLAPEYSVPLGERQKLEDNFTSLKDSVMSYNMDYAPTFFMGDYNG